METAVGLLVDVHMPVLKQNHFFLISEDLTTELNAHLVVHSFRGLGSNPREKGWVREVEGVRLKAKVLHDGGLDAILDSTVHLEVCLGEEIRVEGVNVDELLSLGQGAAVQVQDGGAAGRAAFGEAFLGQRDQTVDLVILD